MSCKSRRMLAPRALVGWLLIASAAIAGLGGGCSGSEAGSAATGALDGGLATSSASSTGGGGGSEPVGDTARDLWDAIEEDMLAECGACHQAQGSADAPFLAGPDRYGSITAWPGIVVADPQESLIITRPADPNHGGGEAPSMSDDLQARALVWLAKEASELPVPDADAGPKITPSKPFVMGAFNTIYFNELGDDFKFMSIAFYAEELGGTPEEPSMLSLTDITVHPVGDKTIHIVHPIFTVYRPGVLPDPDPVDSFSNVDQTFNLAQADLHLGTGAVVLTNWKKDAYLGIGFETIEIYGGGADGGVTDCTDVDLFKSAVVPQMQYCMMTCHGGANPEANATMDLSKLNDADPTDACLQVKARITPGDPATSQILIVTNPDPQAPQAEHMYKFMGNLNKYNEFKTKVSPWIEGEQ